jgi:4-hydroxy-tetrahydrodipicolinate reductase
MINIAIIGIFGRMGQEISQEISKNTNFNLVSGLCRKNQLQKHSGNKAYFLSDNIEEVVSKADIIIDFSNVELSLEVAKIARFHKKNYICGTTGFSDTEFKSLRNLADNSVFIWGSNMSIGINLLISLINKSCNILGNDFDTEIIEMHHRNKKDSPSGTAISLGKEIATAKNLDFNKVAKLSREGTKNIRADNEIGFASFRAGAVIGNHEVVFANDSEIISLKHEACDRSIFAKGSLKAALWSVSKENGFYNIKDIFN